MTKYNKLFGALAGVLLAAGAAFGFGDGASLLGMTEAELAAVFVSIGGVLGTFFAPKNAA
jgi:hypothetical protein